MTTYSDHELEGMLADIESDLTERKQSFQGDAPNKVREAVCAFANDLPDHRKAGVVFVGANDDGSPSGLAVTDELLRALADIKTEGNTLPPPTLTVQKRTLLGAPMAIVTVLPSDAPPVSYRGRWRSKKSQITSGPFGCIGDGPNNRGWRRAEGGR